MDTTSTHSTGTRTARLGRVAAAAIAVALAGIASSTAVAAKPVPAITVVSCQLVQGPTGVGAEITIAWNKAGKVSDPTFIEFDTFTTHDGVPTPTQTRLRRDFSKDELKANELTTVLRVAAGDTVRIGKARWLDADSNIVVSSTNAPIPCE